MIESSATREPNDVIQDYWRELTNSFELKLPKAICSSFSNLWFWIARSSFNSWFSFLIFLLLLARSSTFDCRTSFSFILIKVGLVILPSLKTKPARPDHELSVPWYSWLAGINEAAALKVNLSLILLAHPPESALLPLWAPAPTPHARGESWGTVGNPVKAALNAPTLSIAWSTSRPLIKSFVPLV